MIDEKQLIERIVAEVVRRMGTAGAGSASSPAAAAAPPIPAAELATMIDHTLLRPEASTAAFDKLCQEAVQHKFYSVCVNSCRVAYVARKLQGTGVANATRGAGTTPCMLRSRFDEKASGAPPASGPRWISPA